MPLYSTKPFHGRTLPELCMDLRMHCTGAMDFPAFDEAEAYVRARVDRWNLQVNGPRWAAFDTAVLALCIATLAECDAYVRPVKVTVTDAG